MRTINFDYIHQHGSSERNPSRGWVQPRTVPWPNDYPKVSVCLCFIVCPMDVVSQAYLYNETAKAEGRSFFESFC